MNRFSIPAVMKQMSIIALAAVLAQPCRAGDSPLKQVESGLHDLIYQLSRSIVTVQSSRSAGGGMPGFPTQAIQTTTSTGLMCDSAGHILVSASNVVGYDNIQLYGEDRSLPARVLAVDYPNNLAILESSLPVGDPIQSFADPGVCAGQMVLSLYSANGLRASPSIGFCAGCRTDGFLSFSVPTAPTADGGGIFDLSGRLLGVIIGQSENSNLLASALPSYKLPQIIRRLLTLGDRYAGFAGIATQLTDISPPLNIDAGDMRLAAVGEPSALSHGVVITAVLPNSPAARAGMLPGDLLLGIAGERIEFPDDVARVITALEPSTIVPCRFIRGDHVLTTRIQIAARPAGFVAAAAQSTANASQTGRSIAVDSLLGELSRLRDEVSRIERRLQSID